MYSAGTFGYREPVILNKLQPKNVQIKPAEQTFKKKYRDWTGKYYVYQPLKAANAYDRPMKRPVYDTYADTRQAWIKP